MGIAVVGGSNADFADFPGLCLKIFLHRLVLVDRLIASSDEYNCGYRRKTAQCHLKLRGEPNVS